jgi:hypothetical protein
VTSLPESSAGEPNWMVAGSHRAARTASSSAAL